VVTDEFTYVSSLYPWRHPSRAHVEIRWVPARDGMVDAEELARLVDDRTVAVSMTHVSWQNGFRHDLAALAEVAHARGAVFIVDVAQSAGAVAIDVRRMGIDFLSGCALKWLLGTPGVGWLFMARQHADRLVPPHVGYASLAQTVRVDPEAPLEFLPGARRTESGVPTLPGLAASRAGMELLLDVGIDAVERHVLEVSGACIDGLLRRDLRVLTPRDPARRAGVVGVQAADGPALVAYLRGRGVDVWANPALGLLRIDPHVFNDHADLDRLFDGLDAFIRERGRAAL
jgi:selenocysteine lyase/cysteine desulfurase